MTDGQRGLDRLSERSQTTLQVTGLDLNQGLVDARATKLPNNHVDDDDNGHELGATITWMGDQGHTGVGVPEGKKLDADTANSPASKTQHMSCFCPLHPQMCPKNEWACVQQPFEVCPDKGHHDSWQDQGRRGPTNQSPSRLMVPP